MAHTHLFTPDTVDGAVSQLGELGDRARVLSGGATLVAMMNAQLVDASDLVSLNKIDELHEINYLADGAVRIGAMRRHRHTAFETDLVAGQCVVSQAAQQIANPVVRNMGTIGGSVAFADPAADYPGALVAADASIEIAGANGRRTVTAEAFFLGWYETALESGEIVTAVIVPCAAAGSVGHYAKLCRVAGDFAIASVAINMSLRSTDASTVSNVSKIPAGEHSPIEFIRLVIGGCAGAPVRVPEAERMLMDNPMGEDVVQQASERIVAALDPVDDVRASADYRLTVVPRMIKKALNDAVESAASVGMTSQ